MLGIYHQPGQAEGTSRVALQAERFFDLVELAQFGNAIMVYFEPEIVEQLTIWATELAEIAENSESGPVEHATAE